MGAADTIVSYSYNLLQVGDSAILMKRSLNMTDSSAGTSEGADMLESFITGTMQTIAISSN